MKQLLGEAIEPVSRPGRGKKTNGDTIGFPSNQVESVVARLKRDNPDLADRVVRGETTANAAAREMGWRHPRIVVSSPERVAEADPPGFPEVAPQPLESAVTAATTAPAVSRRKRIRPLGIGGGRLRAPRVVRLGGWLTIHAVKLANGGNRRLAYGA
ncbi:hypothetical protein [Dactylosporangium sp. NPDC051484]|uniref:hypothetical protein n=1 Tax=Dactylosporangium sp. NPDC051484 TaxID=3154942 RepID=UPI00345094A1